uniref:Uncharacterized protein n=1 Tax=Cajanus cajan TaxID=3821 RepID=A0A151UG03_CAJCA
MWNLIMRTHVDLGLFHSALSVYKRMRQKGVPHDGFTFPVVNRALSCMRVGVMCGKMIHCVATQMGLDGDLYFCNTMIDFYVKCGCVGNARRVFDEMLQRDVVSWTLMIGGYGSERDVGSAEEVELLFSELNMKDVVSWNILISFYSSEGDARKVAGLLKEMQGFKVHLWNIETLTLVISAFAKSGSLCEGEGVHGLVIKTGFCDDVLLTSLLDFYAKCGKLETSVQLFSEIHFKNVVAWTTMIEGLGSHGFGFDALKYFQLMIEQRVNPNSVTFLSLLSACSHSGLVREGCNIYHSMKWDFGIEPALDHHTCIVDLFGRCGMLKEALATILKMITLPDSRIWSALLAASRVYGNKFFGEYAAQRLLELEPDNVGYYTLLSNVKACVGKWNEVEELRRVMSERDLKKKPGWSCIEVNGVIHGFVSSDKSHPETEEISKALSRLAQF